MGKSALRTLCKPSTYEHTAAESPRSGLIILLFRSRHIVWKSASVELFHRLVRLQFVRNGLSRWIRFCTRIRNSRITMVPWVGTRMMPSRKAVHRQLTSSSSLCVVLLQQSILMLREELEGTIQDVALLDLTHRSAAQNISPRNWNPALQSLEFRSINMICVEICRLSLRC